MKKQYSVISLDYDGCGAFLFDENVTGIIERILIPYLRGKTNHGDMSPILKFQIEQLFKESSFLQRLNDLARTIIADIKHELTVKILEKSQGEHRILVVGSNRQDHALDILNSFRNRSILCFDAFRQLASRHAFELCELLMADRFDKHGKPLEVKKTVGSTMNSVKPEFSFRDDFKILTQKLRAFHVSSCQREKTVLLQMQLDYFAEIYAEDEIELQFIFFDDLDEIINLNQQKLANGELRLAKHINAELIHFNCIEKMFARIKTEIPRLYTEHYDNLNPANAVVVGEKRKDILELSELSAFKMAKTSLDEEAIHQNLAMP